MASGTAQKFVTVLGAIGEKTTLGECPVGPFISEHGELCLKTEYHTDSGRIMAFIFGSGESFSGGAPTADAHRKLMVTPIELTLAK